jgi:hypothetical protein
MIARLWTPEEDARLVALYSDATITRHRAT